MIVAADVENPNDSAIEFQAGPDEIKPKETAVEDKKVKVKKKIKGKKRKAAESICRVHDVGCLPGCTG